MNHIETVFDKLDREGRLQPVPQEDIAKFRAAMKRVIAENEQYRREQAVLCAEARRRIVF